MVLIYKRMNGELVQSGKVEPGVWIRAKTSDDDSIQKLLMELRPDDMEGDDKTKINILYIESVKYYMMLHKRYLLTAEIQKEDMEGEEQKYIVEFANAILSLLTSNYKEDAGDICKILYAKE